MHPMSALPNLEIDRESESLMDRDSREMYKMRQHCKEFAETHIKEFCASFDIDKANRLLPAKGKDGAQPNSLDKEFVNMLGNLGHIRTA